MMDYEYHFKELEKNAPKVDMLPEGFGTPFWEILYQAFKARMIAESNDGKSHE
jgi:hypothetical protein